MNTGDRQYLVKALEYRTPDEISAKFQAMQNLPATPSSVKLVAKKVSGHEIETYDSPKMVRDSKGDLHIVFIERHTVEWPDYLGNKSLWLCTLYYVQEKGGEWLEPIELDSGHISISEVRLLIDGQDTLHLFWQGQNISPKMSEYALLPGDSAIFTSSRTPEGSWSKPEVCNSEFPRDMNGFDVLLDPGGNFHLVWSPWTTRFSHGRIIYRTRTSDGPWSEETMIPTIGTRTMDSPVIRQIHGQLTVFATGQTSDYKTTGLFRTSKQRNSWSKPELIKDDTTFDIKTNHPDESPLVWIPVHIEKYKYSVMVMDATGRARSRNFSFPDFDPSLSNRVLFSSFNNDIYGIVAWGDAVVLVRGSKGADWLGEPIARDLPARIDDMRIEGRDVYCLVTSGKWSNEIYLIKTRIPQERWKNPEKLTAQLRGGTGLVPQDIEYFRTTILKEGVTAEKNGNIVDALTKYLYIVRNLETANETQVPPPALLFAVTSLISAAC
jgi:hypothetical protein